MASTLDILRRLATNKVEFVLVGGMAGIAHGSSMVTEDVDVCAPLSVENISRILSAIGDLNPRWRMTPQRPAVPRDAQKLATYNNLYMVTDLGQFDVLGEITGVGSFDEVKRKSVELRVGGMECRVLSIDALIQAKRAIGRPRDVQAAMELEAIRGRIGKS
jgi:hypothetical protein